ncbi:D-alanine--D-alanine ligase [Schinkia azotoformans]|uniref:D-alanine--D-alanine ligase n=1 Tax=Schinkia azotoformans LMG 9581 TaxID=1131731 RepID=K6D4E9_SCHAZ|nr:D-alanine--D-alanine ligase [Schinkia azotoformans]EKN67382.1 D-alanine--D-alanine ligase [Schinkia azotoformans LMG 9581]MEC1639365.1 D-alanine--D-alanine ligase [Schinkia azotoformans]MEC1719684.1 D-alanine--D-alanine ligase [Schinkia azotoformans]MEC1944381.1 D-alanine--D-alanine ligase [Schinkia azotoformans]MED4352689.1 D-alanine--D-alanine ligase [Schinkia azotoformans]
MKVAVLYGGTSGEREVSLSSGKGIINALEKKGHEVIGIDFNPSKINELLTLDVDVVFIGLHGRFGEDGRIQGLLDMLNIPYVGSGVLGSALAMNKVKAKRIMESVGIRVAKDQAINAETFSRESFVLEIDYPVVVKPASEGSTIGITIANNEQELLAGIEEAFKHDEDVLIEEFIAGMEVTVSVLGKKGVEQALPVIEIVPKNKFYDYEAKYAPGGSDHIIPARVSDEITVYLQKNAVLAHQSLNCKTYSRTDFIVPFDGSLPVVLEVNTLPGMTPTSLFPDAAKEIGLSYEDMIERLIELSLK